MLTEVKKEIKLTLLSVKYNIMREMANPLSFVLNVIFMMLNNATFLVQWAILFTLKDSFGIYGFKEVCLLWGLSAASYGFAHILFHGAFTLSEDIENGSLDQYLILPRDTLICSITSSTSISAIGDFLYGIILSIVFYHSISDIILIILFTILGAFIYTAFGIIYSSFAFLFTKTSDFSYSIFNMFITFSLYPETVFNKVIRIIFYTFIPVAFAVYLPVGVILNFNILNILLITLFTIFIMLMSYYIFYNGLKKYTSSNLSISR